MLICYVGVGNLFGSESKVHLLRLMKFATAFATWVKLFCKMIEHGWSSIEYWILDIICDN